MTGESSTRAARHDEQQAGFRRERGSIQPPRVHEWMVFGLLVGSGVVLRLACQDLPNFAPVAALALFAGYFFRSAVMALCVPLSVMAISDWFVGGYSWHMMALVYAMLAVPVACRGWLRRHLALRGDQPAKCAGAFAGLCACGLMSSVLFFVVTNFGVWLWFGTYGFNLSGLAHCSVAAVPFFRYTLAGDLFFSFVLFGGYAAALILAHHRSPAVAHAN